MSIIHLNGHLVDEAEAVISVLDRGLLFGDGVFETLRSYDGVLFRLERHLDRLARSLAGLELTWPLSETGIRRDLEALLDANRLGPGGGDGRIRVTITGGRFDGAIRLARSGAPTVIMTAAPLPPMTAAERDNGVRLATARFRQAWDSPLARLKTTHRLEYLLAREEAIRRGADDALILDDRGHVAEGTSSNIMFVHGTRIATPSTDGPLLAGVTREAVLEAARGAGFEVEERAVDPSEIATASEMFVTATSWEILAVASVDGHPVGTGSGGAVARAVHAAFRTLVENETLGHE